MMGLLPLLRVEVVFEAISLVLGLVIAVQSLRAHRVLASGSFLLLGVGFVLMSAAMLFRVSVVGLVVAAAPPMGRPLPYPVLGLFTVEVIYSVIRVVAYTVFVAAYAVSRLRAAPTAQLVFPLLLTIYNPLFEIVSAALLLYVVVETAYNWLGGRPRGSGEIFAGFLTLLVSHILFFITPLGPLFYMLGHVAQLVALTMILLGTHEAGSVPKAPAPPQPPT
ncbi:MAG: hypothetical protein RMJ28_06890 [Nitrososphaerota archaeon]|nr:hypothetical protein [Candidatus Calditenuaceae archaeon]MDW8073939.1 hypothetical protein [Nitrososphaerota archaeon]